MFEILFEHGEYTTCDTGVSIPVTTIVDKLPPPQRTRFKQLDAQARADSLWNDLLERGIQAEILRTWLSLNFQQLRKPEQGRQPTAYYRLLSNLDALSKKYNAEAMNAAILKIVGYHSPQKCTIAYLRTVLKAADNNPSSPSPSIPSTPLSPSPSNPSPQDKDESWDHILRILEQRITSRNYDTWIRPLICTVCSRHEIRLTAPNPTAAFWLEQYYSIAIAQAYCHITGYIPHIITFECPAQED